MPKNHLQNRYDLRQIVARRVGKCVTMRNPVWIFQRRRKALTLRSAIVIRITAEVDETAVAAGAESRWIVF